MENLIYLFLLLHPATRPEKLYDYWYKDKVLAEYERPEKTDLTKMVTEVKAEIRMKLIQV